MPKPSLTGPAECSSRSVWPRPTWVGSRGQDRAHGRRQAAGDPRYRGAHRFPLLLAGGSRVRPGRELAHAAPAVPGAYRGRGACLDQREPDRGRAGEEPADVFVRAAPRIRRAGSTRHWPISVVPCDSPPTSPCRLTTRRRPSSSSAYRGSDDAYRDVRLEPTTPCGPGSTSRWATRPRASATCREHSAITTIASPRSPSAPTSIRFAGTPRSTADSLRTRPARPPRPRPLTRRKAPRAGRGLVQENPIKAEKAPAHPPSPSPAKAPALWATVRRRDLGLSVARAAAESRRPRSARLRSVSIASRECSVSRAGGGSTRRPLLPGMGRPGTGEPASASILEPLNVRAAVLRLAALLSGAAAEPGRPTARVQTPPVAGRPRPSWAASGLSGWRHGPSPPPSASESRSSTASPSSDPPRGLLASPGLERFERLPLGLRVQRLPDQTVTEPPSHTFLYRLRPTRAGVAALPPVVISAFNPATASYETKATPSIPLRVADIPRLDAGAVVDRDSARNPTDRKGPMTAEPSP